MNKNYFFQANQLNDTEIKVLKSIIRHLEQDDKKVTIAQVAEENFVSTGFIFKMCKRLGFHGYSDLIFHLSRDRAEEEEAVSKELATLIDNYDPEEVQRFVDLLRRYREQKFFVVGAGFADIVADYFAQRLSVCGFMVMNGVNFYDYMLFRDHNKEHLKSNVEPTLLIAISQSGETESVLDNVRRAKHYGFQIVAFSKMETSSLSELSDITFLVESAEQALIAPLPNKFFGKAIIIIEEILDLYFQQLA